MSSFTSKVTFSPFSANFTQYYGKAEAVARRGSVKRVFLKISQNSQEYTCVWVFFNKVTCLRPTTLLKKETPTKLFSGEFSELFKNTYFVEHLRTAAPGRLQKQMLVEVLQPAFLVKKGLRHSCCSLVNFSKVLRSHFLQNISHHICYENLAK